MKKPLQIFTATALAIMAGPLATLAQTPPATPQGYITGKAFTGIPGTAVANLTASPRFPNEPDAIMFPTYFEWNATGDIFTPPPDWGNEYGTQLIGWFYPPATGDYTFLIAADDNAALYLSTNSSPANKRLIAQESAWSNAREYFSSGGNSIIAFKDSSQFTNTQWEVRDEFLGGARITLQANQPYYIEALAKEGGGGDRVSVSVYGAGQAFDPSLPIPGEFLSSDRTPGPVTITQQPQSQGVDERGTVTFRVLPDGTPPYTFQWRRDGVDILDATNLTYTVTNAAMTDDNAAFSVFITGAQGNATSTDAVLTVLPDTIAPTLLGAKGKHESNGTRSDLLGSLGSNHGGDRFKLHYHEQRRRPSRSVRCHAVP